MKQNAEPAGCGSCLNEPRHLLPALHAAMGIHGQFQQVIHEVLLGARTKRRMSIGCEGCRLWPWCCAGLR